MALPELGKEELTAYFDQIGDDRIHQTVEIEPNVIGSHSNLDSIWLNTTIVDGLKSQNFEEDYYSDTESLGSAVSAVPSPAVFADTEANERFSFIPDEELKQLSVKELNSKLKGHPKDVVRNIKKRRRTLKNRGYAHSCRIKRIVEKSSLLKTKSDMEGAVAALKLQVSEVTAERDFYKSKYEALVRHLVKLQTRKPTM